MLLQPDRGVLAEARATTNRVARTFAIAVRLLRGPRPTAAEVGGGHPLLPGGHDENAGVGARHGRGPGDDGVEDTR